MKIYQGETTIEVVLAGKGITNARVLQKNIFCWYGNYGYGFLCIKINWRGYGGNGKGNTDNNRTSVKIQGEMDNAEEEAQDSGDGGIIKTKEMWDYEDGTRRDYGIIDSL